MFQYQTIEPGTLQLLKQLQDLPILKESRLVGGTALALQLGHRKSVDLDFFGSINASSEELRDTLSYDHSLTVVKESKNINIYLIDGIKVDIVNYKYEWIDKPVEEDAITLAGIKDIAAMKIAAVVGRGTKKDFIDLFFLLRQEVAKL
ncbi:MAG: nucleotidyl transferase AbiEii/AbiGii toxin family protein [Bacteroidales bacterium]|nr:nucleotidyl transferase AbiEii/AbiGii toxin family protein [Bacteroidales bacterium]